MGMSIPIRTRDHRVTVQDTEQVHVVEISAVESQASRPTILALQGTTGAAFGTRRWRLRLGKYMASHGFRFYLSDCRGYGYSDGNFEDATVSGCLDDAEAVLSWMRSQDQLDADRIGVFGFSLGSAIAVLLAQRHPEWMKSLLTYTLPCDMEKGYLWYFERFAQRSLDRIYSSPGKAWIGEFGEYFSRAFLDDLVNHDVKEAIARLEIPMLLIQPKNDDQVPSWVSDQAYALKPEPKERIDIDGTHTMVKEDGWDFEQEREVTDACLDWFSRTL